MNATITLPRSLRVAVVLLAALATGFILKAAQGVLVPIALAALVAFVLNPLVVRVRRLGAPQPVAVLGVVILAAVAVLVAAVGVSTQIKQLADDIPRHRETIEQRVLALKRLTRGGTLERLRRTIRGIDAETERVADAESRANGTPTDGDDVSGFSRRWEEWTERLGISSPRAATPPAESATQPGTGPAATAAARPQTSLWEFSPWYVSALELLGVLGVVALLTTFFLIQQRDIRDRIVGIAGRGALATTTKAVGDAGARISRYLFMQFVINATYGIAVAIGLLFADVQYALLWGFVACICRYVPYVGPWVGAILPITVSLAMNEGWWKPGLVVALFIVLELVSNNVMEPLLYGHSVGLSETAVILAAIFWAWMWGPVGLVLATPMTACLVVLGNHIPELRIFDQLLGSAPQVGAPMRLYQRLLARSEDDVQDLIDEFLAKHSLGELCDALLIPALEYGHHDAAIGQLDDADIDWIRNSITGIVDDLHESEQEARDEDPPVPVAAAPWPNVVGVVAQSADEAAALHIVSLAVRDLECRFEPLSDDLLISERIERIAELEPLAVCISAMSPGDLSRSRLLTKRIRARLPEVKIVVCRWSADADSPRNRSLLHAGADLVVTRVGKLHAALRSALQVHRATQQPRAKADSHDSAA